MKWWLVGGGVALASLTTLYLVHRSQTQEPVEELPDNSDEDFTQQVTIKWKDTKCMRMGNCLPTDGIILSCHRVFSMEFDIGRFMKAFPPYLIDGSF